MRWKYEIATVLAVGVTALTGALMIDAKAQPGPTTTACDTDAECAALPICAADPNCDGGPNTHPRLAVVLVGEGCGPKGVVMVAREEDEFPTTCAKIEAYWLP